MSALTKELGFALVERSGRSFTLTADGQALADAIDGAFSSIERTLADVGGPQNILVFAVQPAMATSWIVPMLDQLETAAGVEIQLRIYERRSELDSSGWDLAIVPGTGDWPAWESTMLFGEAVRPFAAPSLALQLGLDATTAPSALVGHNLLHIDERERPNMTWSEWFSEAGGTTELPKPRLLYNAYPTVIQEALAGNGIALGWQHLLSDLVERGLLAPVGPVVQRNHGGHHLCWRSGRGNSRHRAVLELLQAEILNSSAPFATP